MLLKQESVSGSGISWAICKYAPSYRQITMRQPTTQFFLQAGCPSCRPTNSGKALKAPLRYTITSIRVSSGADVSQATHEQTSYVYDTSLIYRNKPYNKNSKTRSRRQAGRRMLPPGRSTHARTGGRTNRKHNADAAHKLAGGGTVKERIKISR